jgi:protein O-mannosyl-transferase
MPALVKRHPAFLIQAAIIVAALLVYLQTARFTFINYDDTQYVFQNARVLSGLSRDNIVWAFTTEHASNWHPLTWLSHMLDCQLFGPAPGAMHSVNLFFHIANSMLLFAVLLMMSGALWQSGFVAAAFALHPMHVQSVAWIAERKDLLSTFFLLLTFIAYIAYTTRPNVYRYLTALFLFACSLMAKPMFVTLPFLLLLLDYWPLGRLRSAASVHSGSRASQNTGAPWLIAEKLPLLALSLILCLITLHVQQSGGGLINSCGFGERVANAIVSYARYIGLLFWPRNLSVFYPFPVQGFPAWQVISCALLMVLISVLVHLARKRRYLTVGWLWFVGTLVPVIGIVQVGSQALADRYSYVPCIGLLIMLAWGASELLSGRPWRKLILGASMLVILTVMALAAHRETSYWKDGLTLFSQSIERTSGNYIAYNNRAAYYFVHDRWQEAAKDLDQSIAIKPDFAEALTNRGLIYARYGRYQAAAELHRRAIASRANYDEGRNNLAWLIATTRGAGVGDPDEAIRLALSACEISGYSNPSFMDTLAAAYASAGMFAKAIDMSNKAIALARNMGQTELVNTIISHLRLYQQSKPYIETPVPEKEPLNPNSGPDKSQ